VPQKADEGPSAVDPPSPAVQAGPTAGPSQPVHTAPEVSSPLPPALEPVDVEPLPKATVGGTSQRATAAGDTDEPQPIPDAGPEALDGGTAMDGSTSGELRWPVS
jgi:hypothetical protein